MSLIHKATLPLLMVVALLISTTANSLHWKDEAAPILSVPWSGSEDECLVVVAQAVTETEADLQQECKERLKRHDNACVQTINELGVTSFNACSATVIAAIASSERRDSEPRIAEAEAVAESLKQGVKTWRDRGPDSGTVRSPSRALS